LKQFEAKLREEKNFGEVERGKEPPAPDLERGRININSL